MVLTRCLTRSRLSAEALVAEETVVELLTMATTVVPVAAAALGLVVRAVPGQQGKATTAATATQTLTRRAVAVVALGPLVLTEQHRPAVTAVSVRSQLSSPQLSHPVRLLER
jgi:hypothetical protein